MTKAVDRGAALLDDEVPGWRKRIDIEGLDMANSDCCVIGQLYGHYTEGLTKLDIYGKDVEYGFDVRGWEEEDRVKGFKRLQRQWVKKIQDAD